MPTTISDAARLTDIAGEVDSIADLVNSLALLHGDPHRFHEIKDTAAKRCRALARKLRGGRDEPKASMAERRAEMGRMIAGAKIGRRS